MENALKSTHFLTRFGKDNHEIEAGTFDRGSNDVTRGVLLPFLMEAFQYFKNELPEEWELGDANSGVLTINNTIHALLRILNDIIDFLIERDKINPKIMDTRVLLEKVEPYLAPLVSYFGSINETRGKESVKIMVVEAKREFGVLSSQLLTRHNQNLNQMALERGFAIIQSNSMQSPIR